MAVEVYNPIEDMDKDPLLIAFFKKFGGSFAYEIAGPYLYTDKDMKAFSIPNNKTELFDLVTKSLKENDNWLAKEPFHGGEPPISGPVW
jgi:hypothetical protein